MKRVAALVLLSLLGGLTAVVTICAFLLPYVPSDDRAMLLRRGYRLAAVRFDRPRLERDRLVFDRIEVFLRAESAERHERIEAVSVPRAGGIGRPDAALATILAAAGLRSPEDRLVSDGAEVAFVSPWGILWRRRDGGWANASGGEVPGRLRRGTLDDSDPDRWLDAALAAWLRGPCPEIFTDALVRSDGGEFREFLIRVLVELRCRDEIARAILRRNDDGHLQLRLLQTLEELDGSEPVRGKAEALVVVARERWRGASPYLREWLARSLEDGSFELARDRRAPFERMTQFVDASFRDRLARVVEEREGASCAAACLILRRLAGEGDEAEPDPAFAPAAKRWWAENGRRVMRLLGD